MKNYVLRFTALGFIMMTMIFATCKYGFKDVSPIPPEIKTFSINAFDNRARYVNPQFAPKLTEEVRQKVICLTRLKQVTGGEMGDYDISGYVSDYSVSTSGVVNQQAGTNRLNVTFHLIFKNSQDAKKNFEADLNSTFDFNANSTLQEAEQEIGDKLVKNVGDAIFNRIFSNW